jgi:hypothetical protein
VQQALQGVLAGIVEAGQGAGGGGAAGAGSQGTSSAPPSTSGFDTPPAVGFEGRWHCAVTPESTDGVAARETLDVRRNGGGYEASAVESAARLVSTSVRGSRITFEGRAGVRTTVWGGRYDLLLSGEMLSGEGVEYIVSERTCDSCAAERETIKATVSCSRRPRW